MSEPRPLFERRVTDRVYELTRGWHPAQNTAPLTELVRTAYALGYEVIQPVRDYGRDDIGRCAKCGHRPRE